MTILHYFNSPIILWTNCGDFMQTKWESILDIIGDNPFHHYVTYTVLLTIIVYWIIGGIFTFMDVTNKPEFLRKYKIQPGTNEPVEKEKLKKALITIVINQTFVAYCTGFIFYKMLEIRGHPSIRELPSFFTVIGSILVFILIEEIGFYYTHRLMHNKYLYKVIHKKHHEWTSPIAITATYCHPIEHIISNLGPIMAGPLILDAHVATSWLWFSLAIASTLSDHSGYHLPFFPSSEFHDFHHLKFTNCFGVLGLLDWLHKTDEMFRSTTAFKRHFVLLDSVSARQVFPDLPKKSL